MKNKIDKLINYFDNLKFRYKTAFLIFIIAGGMICIIILSQISIFAVKQDFDILFDKRTKSLMQLENIKDTFQVNVQDTLRDFEKKQISFEQTSEVLKLAQEIIDKNWLLYKNQIKVQNKDFLTTFIKDFIIKEENYYENKALKNNIMNNINTKMQIIKSKLAKINIDTNEEKFHLELNLQINAVSIYLTSLINYDLSLAINEKRNTDKIFNIILIFSIISIFIVFLFSIILSIFIINNFKKLHNSLEQKVDIKTKELQELNMSLESKISKEVSQNRKKDIIMFQQARLASLGEMLNNIAHQWRQPRGRCDRHSPGRRQVGSGRVHRRQVRQQPAGQCEGSSYQCRHLRDQCESGRHAAGVADGCERHGAGQWGLWHRDLDLAQPERLPHAWHEQCTVPARLSWACPH